MSELLNGLSIICLLLGCICNILSGIGLFRFPDLYTRMHAAGVIDTLGSGLILIGLMLLSDWSTTLSKLILILVFSLLTAPTITYTLANAAALASSKENTKELTNSEKRTGENSSNR